MTTALSIREVAAATGLSIHTLRYYERIGLIDAVPRRHNGHRQYREADLRWLEFLLRLRSTGLPIQQMVRYADLRRRGNQLESLAERKDLLARHAAVVETQLAALQDTLTMLRSKVAMYADMEADYLHAGNGPATKRKRS